MPRTFLLTGLTLLLLAAAPRVAAAQDPAMDTARTHFEAGQDLFDKGDYARAADEFLKAYAAKPFPAFLFNAAVCYEKLQDYEKAVELFKRYLAEDPQAADRAEVEKRIAALEKEIARPATQPSTQPTGVEPPPPGGLPEARTKGVVVIESKPPGATIYLDNKRNGPIGQTPWNGSLDGEHTIILESKGYKAEKKKISPSPDKLVILYFSLSEEHYLGWLEVRANVPGADVYLDDKGSGAVGRTPFMGNVQPGKHTIWVTREGYTEVQETIEIQAGKAHNINVTLEKAPIGFVRVRGNETTEGARVRLDGRVVCPTAPCRFEAPEGRHKISVSRGGKKTLTKKITVERATETELVVRLAPTPSRTDAIWPILFAGGFIVGGYYLVDYAGDQTDPDQEKAFRYLGYASYGLGGISALTGVWYLVRDKGPPSTATVESRSISWAPAVGPGFAGVAGAGSF